MTDKTEMTMLYKAGGKHKIHGGLFDYLIVHTADEMKAALADGWCKTTTEAAQPSKLAKKPKTGKKG